jgi:hypothetical protein
MQNRITTKLWNRLGEEPIDVQMQLNMSLPIVSADFAAAVRHWRAIKKKMPDLAL